MIQVQSSLTGGYVPVIVMPGRQFIKEGKMMKVRESKVNGKGKEGEGVRERIKKKREGLGNLQLA